jgi:aldose 1-epimerase
MKFKVNWHLIIVTSTLFIFVSCSNNKNGKESVQNQKGALEMTIHKELFGKLPDGREVDIYTLDNAIGLKVKIMTYGATIVSLETPDRNGNMQDIVLGHDNLQGYLTKSPYFGAIVGRYANRIKRGSFSLDSRSYQLTINNGLNHLHGGVNGFDKVLWTAEPVKEENFVGLRLSYNSPDGDQGYPGELKTVVSYTLTKDSCLKVEFQATTNRPTIVNLSNHSYFNLSGQGGGDILSHELMLNCDHYLPVDTELIPTGEIKKVKDTPFDFTSPFTIGARIAEIPGGYDHNYVISDNIRVLKLAAKVYESGSGRTLTLSTTCPGVQFYSGNFLDGTIRGKEGENYQKHGAFCLEPQFFPDSPNRPDFPSVRLNPGDKFHQCSIYKFGINNQL